MNEILHEESASGGAAAHAGHVRNVSWRLGM
jgi:hypothetical protein